MIAKNKYRNEMRWTLDMMEDLQRRTIETPGSRSAAKRKSDLEHLKLATKFECLQRQGWAATAGIF